ncbi:MAG TPA: helix-turn-helix domain-containing protein, partial [Lachnospiraceae bacterium]|nr:helix-turn-helix domain-containing protein [Lachnospiraceae bacterium]
MKTFSADLLSSTVASLRKSKSLSQQDLSDLTGINRAVISRLESNNYVPSIEQLEALGKALDFDPLSMFVAVDSSEIAGKGTDSVESFDAGETAGNAASSGEAVGTVPKASNTVQTLSDSAPANVSIPANGIISTKGASPANETISAKAAGSASTGNPIPPHAPLSIAVAGTGYVGLSIATLLSQHNHVTAVDIVPEKVGMINNRKSPIQDEYIEDYLANKDLDLTATLNGEEAYRNAEFVIIATPTNYDSQKNYFDTSAV